MGAPAGRWLVQVVLTCAGQVIQGIRFLQPLAVFIPRCTWLPSLRDQGMRGVVPVPVGYYGLQGHAGCQGEISCDPLLWGYLGCGFSVAVPIAVPWAHRCCVAAAVRVQS